MGEGDTRAESGNLRAELGFKLKPDTFDSLVSLREFLSQFNLIARANHWNDTSTTVALASCLRRKVRTVLESVKDLERLDFAELRSVLELRFGEGNLSQNYCAQFAGRRQRNGEDPAILGADLERLSRLSYPECPYDVRDKIACTQFIAALTGGFVKTTFQLEGITSLRQAVERAKAIRNICADSFERQKKFGNYGGSFYGKPKFSEREDSRERESKEEKGRKRSWRDKKSVASRECWTCGKTGHFRSECPQEGNSV